MTRTIARAALSLVALLIGSPAWAQSRVPGVTDSEVALGVTTALSGPAAAWGASAVGMKAWASYVNDQGGIHDRKIRVVIRDDGHNPGRALANLKEMQGSVFALVGLLGSAVVTAAKDDIAEYGIPLINPYGNPAIWAGQPRDKIRWVFVNHPDYLDEAAFLVAHAVHRLGATRIAVFYQNDEYGKAGRDGVRLAVRKFGATAAVSAEVPYELTDRLMGTHALKLKESGADAVTFFSTPSHTANVIKEMAKVAYRPKLLASFPLGDHVKMFSLLGELWEGAYYDVIWSVRGEPAADRVIDILTRYEPNLRGNETFGLAGAIPMMMTVEGLRRAGRNLTREGFIRAMESLHDFSPENLTAPMTFGPNRRHGLNAVRLMRAERAADSRVVAVGSYQFFPPRF